MCGAARLVSSAVVLLLAQPVLADAPGRDALLDQVVDRLMPGELERQHMPWGSAQEFEARVADLTAAAVRSRPYLPPARRQQIEATNRVFLRCAQKSYLDAMGHMRALLRGGLNRASDAELQIMSAKAGAQTDALYEKYAGRTDMVLLVDQFDSEVSRGSDACLVAEVNAMKKIGVIPFDAPTDKLLHAQPAPGQGGNR